MVQIALTLVAKEDAPAGEQSRTITCEIETLAAAFQETYLAGQADAARAHETLVFLHRTIRNMQRSMRRARPTPREGVEAGLDLMLRAVEERLGIPDGDALRIAA